MYELIWELYLILFGLIGILSLVLILFLGLILYVFMAYVFARIGRKFGVGSFPKFLVPVYDIMLLCDCAKISRWFTVALLLPVIAELVSSPLLSSWLISLIVFASHVYLWGKIAERLGKNFWLWGIITPLLGGFPSIILAFDSSMPPGGTRIDEESRETVYIEI